MGEAAMNGFVPLGTNYDPRPLQAGVFSGPPESASLHCFYSPSWPRHERYCSTHHNRGGVRMMLSLVTRSGVQCLGRADGTNMASPVAHVHEGAKVDGDDDSEDEHKHT